MDPNIKRYLPWIGVVVAVVVGVYFIGGKRLTGEAGLDDPNLAHLGTVKPELLEKLDQLVAEPVLPHVQSEGRGKATGIEGDFEKLGLEGLATVMQHFKDNGCVQPGSAVEVELIRRLLDDDKITSLQRRVVAYILIDAAEHASKDFEIQVAEPFTVFPEVGKVVAAVDKGDFKAALPKGLPLKPDDPYITYECTVRALDITAEILKTGVIDARALQDKSLIAVKTLPKQHPALPAFMKVLTLAANASKQPAPVYAELVGDKNLSNSLRAVACEGAIAAGVKTDELNKVLADDKPVELQHCLVDAGDKITIEAALESADLELRIKAVSQVPIDPNPAKIKEILTETYKAEMASRERFAWLNAIAAVAVESKEPEKLLASIDELHTAQPEMDVPSELARIIHRRNTKKPQIGPIGEEDEEPSLSQSLGDLAIKGGTIIVATALKMEVTAEKDEEGLKEMPLDREALEFCDAVLEPGEAKVVFEGPLKALKDGESRVVCLRPGEYTGPLTLAHEGLRIIALGKGVRFPASIMLKAPTFLLGLEIIGPVLVAEAARGSILVSNRFEAGAVSETTQIYLEANTVGENMQVIVPGGVVAEADSKPAGFTYEPVDPKANLVPSMPRWPPAVVF